jgi:hypothetical protein
VEASKETGGALTARFESEELFCGLRAGALDFDTALGNQRGNGADCGKNRRKDSADNANR